MFLSFILSTLKDKGGFLLITLIFVGSLGFLSYKNYSLQNQNKSLIQDKIIADQERVIAKQETELKIKTLTDQHNERDKALRKYYEDQYQILRNDANSSKLLVDELRTSTSKTIRDNLSDPSISKEVATTYVFKYQEVFSECVQEYAEVAKDADELVLQNISLNMEIDNLYTLLEEFSQINHSGE